RTLLAPPWDGDLDGFFGPHPPGPVTLVAGQAHHRALARAARARRDRHELAEYRARRSPHLAGSAAGGAGRGARPVLPAGPAARSAAVQGAQPHRLNGTFRDLVERQLQRDLQILAALAVAPGALATAEEGIEPSQPAEVAHEDVERLGEVEVREVEP